MNVTCSQMVNEWKSPYSPCSVLSSWHMAWSFQSRLSLGNKDFAPKASRDVANVASAKRLSFPLSHRWTSSGARNNLTRCDKMWQGSQLKVAHDASEFSCHWSNLTFQPNWSNCQRGLVYVGGGSRTAWRSCRQLKKMKQWNCMFQISATRSAFGLLHWQNKARH